MKSSQKSEFIGVVIGESYFRIQEEPSEANLQLLEKVLYQAINETMELRKMEIHFIITTEKGSIKLRGKFWITMALFGNIIVQYPDFKEGVREITKDITHAIEVIQTHFNNNPATANLVVERTEKRLGIPGKIYRILQSLERIENGPGLNDPEVQEDLTKNLEDLSEILILIGQPESDLLLNSLSIEIQRRLPNRQNIPDNRLINRYGIKTETE